MDDAVGGGLVDSILRSADGIWNDSPLGQDSGTSINWAGDWDSWWESETGSQSDDLYLKASSDAFTIAALALPVADAVDGAADAIRGSDLLADLFRASEGGDSWITRLLAPNITAHAAEDAGTAAGKEITTYYPPDRGFFDEPTSQVLDTGTRIDRYGGEGGTFVSPEGTPEPMRALPPGATTRPYNIYEVVNPIEVRAGTVAPWFGQLGLGTQYELPDSVGNLIENGYLKLAEDGG
jgi:hypothetical protein